jgi:hypothetical protein
MAEHAVKIVEVPELTLGNADMKLAVHADETTLGHLTISRGGLGWFPSHGHQERHMTWEQFDKLIRKEFGEAP